MKYQVTFTLKQPSEVTIRTRVPGGRDRLTSHRYPPDVRGTVVEARNELSAIHSAQFQLKRQVGFDVSWLDKMPRPYGYEFLHELWWTISIKELP